MFEPGRLHLEHSPVQPPDVAYELIITYAPASSQDGPSMHFQVTGHIAGQPVDESFDLAADLAFNFASSIDHLARRHGLPATQVVPISLHRQYDEMFADIQHKLGRHCGDPVDARHLGKT
ncbi:DUF5064 family protein [Pseudomonas massiliensis]|uniref:DUF5064 family protein n=1 Tax=Pseudomonas massiliensis TaxID=522492 RepID=UPI0005903E9F|nr:DUF5064 family protein [Pseudomonas massiliensis]